MCVSCYSGHDDTASQRMLCFFYWYAIWITVELSMSLDCDLRRLQRKKYLNL